MYRNNKFLKNSVVGSVVLEVFVLCSVPLASFTHAWKVLRAVCIYSVIYLPAIFFLTRKLEKDTELWSAVGLPPLNVPHTHGERDYYHLHLVIAFSTLTCGEADGHRHSLCFPRRRLSGSGTAINCTSSATVTICLLAQSPDTDPRLSGARHFHGLPLSELFNVEAGSVAARRESDARLTLSSDHLYLKTVRPPPHSFSRFLRIRRVTSKAVN